ncbi:hypothetical protein ACJ41O_014698 [Fusarium nematophilum]
MRISASLGVILASGLLGHSGAQGVDYGNPNANPGGNPGDGSGGVPPSNPNGAPGNMPFPTNVPGTAPGSFPGQADPNNPGTVPGGLPPSIPGVVDPNTPGAAPGGIPPNVPGGVPETLPGSHPGDVPVNSLPGAGSVIIPGSFPTSIPQNVPGAPGFPSGGVPTLPTCPILTTKTVFVTVYPTDPQDVSGFPVPDGSDPDQPAVQTSLPTQPAQLSSTRARPDVSAFTTITVDLWGPSGNGAGSAPDPTSGSGAEEGGDAGSGADSGSGDDAHSGNESDDLGPSDGMGPEDGTGPGNGTGSDNTGSGDDPNSTVVNGSGSPDGPNVGSGSQDGVDPNVGNGPQDSTDSPFFSPVPGPDTAPEYSDGASSGGLPGGPGDNTQAPVPVPVPSQFPGSSITGGVPGSQPQNPSAGTGQEASDSLPVTTQVNPQDPAGSSPWFTSAPGGDNAGEPLTACITITGADGLPTVISGGDGIAPGQIPPSFTSGASPDGNGQGLPSGTASGVPFPLPSVTGIPDGSDPQGPSEIPGAPLPGDCSEAGVTTCATFIITGTNGLPTVVDSTWVIPFSTPIAGDSSALPITGVPQGTLSGIPIDIGSIPTGPVPAPGSPQDDTDGLVATTCTSYTVIGTDGLPTVVHSTWTVPTGTPGSGDASGAPLFPTFSPDEVLTGLPTASGLDGTSPITASTSYTTIGSDGLPTIVDSTWVVPGPVNTGSAIPGGPGSPSEASDALPNGVPPAVTTQATGIPAFPSSGTVGSGIPAGEGITTCTSYTIIGPDGRPTVVDSTWVIPGAINTGSALPGNPSFVSDSLPSGLPTGIPGQATITSSLPSEGNLGDVAGITTCTTFTILGTDGLPTIVDSTWVIPTGSDLPTGTNLGLPSITGVPEPIPSDGSAGAFTTLTTAVIIGPDGKPTATVQTVILSASSALGVSTSAPQGTISGIPAPAPSGPVLTSGDIDPLSSAIPTLNDYGAGLPDESLSAIVTGASGNAVDASVTGTVTGTRTWTITSVIDPAGSPIFSGGVVEPASSYDPLGTGASDQLPQTAYGPVPSEITLWPLSAPSTSLKTSTWTNVIVEETTSYTINYPLTTLATVTVPGKRLVRRQDLSAWANTTTSSTSFTENTSLGASLSSALSTADTLPTSLPSLSTTSSTSASSETRSTTISEASAPSICAAGVSIGNTTIDFDNSKSGPLFNPVENVWFSGGFLIAPPTSQQPQPYIPSSGGQIVEFVPPSLSNTTTSEFSDVAQIGMGPHASSPCFRFNFFGARLGCDAQGAEKWCEFEISAYRYNKTSSREESIAWSETKYVPVCPTFSGGGYELTPIELEGYTDLSSVLITLRVGQEVRVWWGDDFRVGWTDNSCVAAACRTSVPSHRVKRETVVSALRRGVYKWARDGLERVDDALV